MHSDMSNALLVKYS